MSKVINIGKSKTEVQLTHAKKSAVYFIKNILGYKLLLWQEKFIKATTKNNNRMHKL